VRHDKPNKSDSAKAEMAKIKSALDEWDRTGVLAREVGLDEHRHEKEFYVVGPGAAGPLFDAPETAAVVSDD
jgi:hypothetical protein